MLAVAVVALTLGLGGTAVRVWNDFRGRWVYHLWERDAAEGLRTVFETSHAAPVWPRFRAKLLGRPWPGDYVCRECDGSHKRYARRVATSFGPAPAAFEDATLRASGQLPPYPSIAMRREYLEKEQSRRLGPGSQVLIEADASLVNSSVSEGRWWVGVPGQATYVIRVANSGTRDATRVVVSAVLSDNTALGSISSPVPGLVETDPIQRTIVFPAIERLTPGDSMEFEVKVRATKPGPATCRVSLTGDERTSP